MFRRIAILSVVGALALPVMVQAQDQGGDQQRSNRDRGGDRGGFDPAAMRERMEKYMKEQLGVSDDAEWKVIQPKLEKVSTLSRESRGGGMMFGGRDRSRGDSNQPKSDVQKAQSDLKETLDKKEASVEDINAKLAALRTAREKAKADLKTAQKDLSEVLTARQIATLVMMGMLE
jgi:chromosome segregation ATPase